MAKNVTCKYRITVTVKADTNYELEVIKKNLIGPGQTSFTSTPSRSSRGKSVQTHQNMQLDVDLARSKRQLLPLMSH